MSTPDAAKQSVRVTIFNQTYTLSTSGDAQETQRLAQEIDDLMSSIARRAGNLDSTRTAVLACMHLADRLRAVERELHALRESVSDRSRGLASRLDRVLAGAES